MQSVQESIDAIRSAYRPFSFGRGLSSLPDELLQMVFEYIADIKTLSLVCRRFRRVVLDSPRLWATISNSDISLPYVIKSLERSKATALDILLQLRPAPVDPNSSSRERNNRLDVVEVLNAVLPHRNRWNYLEICVMIEKWEDLVERLTETCSHLMNLNLPLLTGLKICYPESMVHVNDYDINKMPLLDPKTNFHLYKSFIAPQLQSVHFVNVIPGPIPTSPMLTSCKIVIHDELIGAKGLRDILAFLSSATALENLSLTLHCCEMDTDETYPVQVLHHLRFLELHVADTNSTWVRPFRAALVTPVIRTFRILVSAGYPPDDASEEASTGDRRIRFNWLELMLCHDEYPALEELYAEFCSNSGVISEYPFAESVYNIPFDKVPNLRDLTLWSMNMNPAPTMIRRIPSLQTIRLLSPATDWKPFLETVIGMLRAQGDIACLQNLVVYRPAYLPQSSYFEIQAIIPERKIEWEVD